MSDDVVVSSDVTPRYLFFLSMCDSMLEMGFAEELVLAALKQTDNNMVTAINMIQNEPELLIESPTQTSTGNRQGEAAPIPLNDEVGFFFLKRVGKCSDLMIMSSGPELLAILSHTFLCPSDSSVSCYGYSLVKNQPGKCISQQFNSCATDHPTDGLYFL